MRVVADEPDVAAKPDAASEGEEGMPSVTVQTAAMQAAREAAAGAGAGGSA